MDGDLMAEGNDLSLLSGTGLGKDVTAEIANALQLTGVKCDVAGAG